MVRRPAPRGMVRRADRRVVRPRRDPRGRHPGRARAPQGCRPRDAHRSRRGQDLRVPRGHPGAADADRGRGRARSSRSCCSHRSGQAIQPGCRDPSMGPGVWFRRRTRVPSTVVVVVLSIATFASAASAQAAVSPGNPVTTDRWDPSAGEAGSGSPALPVVYPSAPGGRTLTTSAALPIRFSDLKGSDGWAKEGIRVVAAANDRMRDFAANADGTYPFRPHAIETRKYLARSVVRAFAPDEAPDPSIVFPDLDASSALYRYAAVAVRHGWIARKPD